MCRTDGKHFTTLLRILSATKHFIYFVTAVNFLSAGTFANAQTDSERIKELEERIDDLEGILADVDNRVGSRAVINAFEGLSIDLGGFLHSTLTHADGEAGSATSFNRNIFELLIRTELDQRWSAFIAQAFIRESDPLFDDDNDGISNEVGERLDPRFELVSSAPQVIAWSNYRHSDVINVQFGRFIAPHGIINIDHFPATLFDPEQPQFLRPFSGQTIFPNFVDGIQFHGTKFLGKDKNPLSYNLYFSNFVGNADDFVSGARISYELEDLGLTFGVNLTSGTREEAIDSDYQVFGADILYENGPLIWKTEYFVTDEDLGSDRQAFYTQPAWQMNNRWALFYRYDFLDDGSDTGDRVENTIGVNFTPLSNLRLRAIATNRSFDAENGFAEADLRTYQLSATLSF